MSNSTNSPRHPSPSSSFHDATCTRCGSDTIAKAGVPCQQCGGLVRLRDGEITKKVMEAPDLKKGW